MHLYKVAGDRNIADLGTKAYAAAALENLDDLGFLQRKMSKSGWSDSESSEWATVGAVRQGDTDLDLECLRCIQETMKTLNEIVKSLGQATKDKTRSSRAANGKRDPVLRTATQVLCRS